MNYKPEIVAYMVKEYKSEPTRDTVKRLAKELNKSDKSITGKLSKEGVYRRVQYRTKTGKIPRTKLEIVYSIAEYASIDAEKILGLEKAPKAALESLEESYKSNEN